MYSLYADIWQANVSIVKCTVSAGNCCVVVNQYHVVAIHGDVEDGVVHPHGVCHNVSFLIDEKHHLHSLHTCAYPQHLSDVNSSWDSFCLPPYTFMA